MTRKERKPKKPGLLPKAAMIGFALILLSASMAQAVHAANPFVRAALANSTAPTDTGTAPLLPRFSIDIPTVRLTSIQVTTGYIDIPWIADYIIGAYRYAVFLGSILAAVMLMVGGIQWLTAAGNAERVGAAKKRITNAIVGLVLILSSYTLLNTINPDLTLVKGLRVKTVPPEPLEIELQSTTVDTSVQSTSGDNSAYPIAGGSGTYRARYFTSGCPVRLTASGSGPGSERNRQFFTLIYPLLTGSDNGAKLAKAFEAAWVCGVQLGSCGRNISDLAVLVQRGPNEPCLADPNFVTVTLRDGTRQRLGCMDMYSASTRTATGYRTITRTTPPPSIRDAISALQQQHPGYPDSFVSDIRPGDIVTYYNANSSEGGSHRVFVANIDERGMAELLNGAIGRPPYTTNRCLKSSCGNYAPVGVISRLR